MFPWKYYQVLENKALDSKVPDSKVLDYAI